MVLEVRSLVCLSTMPPSNLLLTISSPLPLVIIPSLIKIIQITNSLKKCPDKKAKKSDTKTNDVQYSKYDNVASENPASIKVPNITYTL